MATRRPAGRIPAPGDSSPQAAQARARILHTLRTRAGITQGEAATRAGVSPDTWSRWERGAQPIEPHRFGYILGIAPGWPKKKTARAARRDPKRSRTAKAVSRAKRARKAAHRA